MNTKPCKIEWLVIPATNLEKLQNFILRFSAGKFHNFLLVSGFLMPIQFTVDLTQTLNQIQMEYVFP